MDRFDERGCLRHRIYTSSLTPVGSMDCLRLLEMEESNENKPNQFEWHSVRRMAPQKNHAHRINAIARGWQQTGSKYRHHRSNNNDAICWKFDIRNRDIRSTLADFYFDHFFRFLRCSTSCYGFSHLLYVVLFIKVNLLSLLTEGNFLICRFLVVILILQGINARQWSTWWSF